MHLAQPEQSTKMLQLKNTCTDNLPHDSNPPVIGRIGSLETRLACSEQEVREAQALRYTVFYEELGAVPGPETKLLKRDEDRFDQYCDHILVIDTARDEAKIVGTYRLLKQSTASQIGGFYSQSEFELSKLLDENPHANLLELGRSCILPEYRNKRTMELLWHGAWSYAISNNVDIMFGCASFEGRDPEPYYPVFSWLSQNALLPETEDCSAKIASHTSLKDIDVEAVGPRQVMAAMPPLLKGYLRLGAKVGSHAVTDHQFGTVDVLVVLKVDQINPRYIAHYGADASRFAA